MKICITGVCGFIGFHTASKLLSQGHHVLGLDSLNDYYDVRLKKTRLELLKKAGLEFIQIDISKPQALECLNRFKPDRFLHLAAQAGVRYAAQNPRAYCDANLLGFFEVLEWIKKDQVPLIYASSSSVYGNSSKVPFEEIDAADQPESFYAATKRSNELMAISYHKSFGIIARGLRFFTVYGPYGRPDMAYFSFTKDFLEGKPLKVFHQGQALRDYTYIDDIVEGILGALEDTAECSIYNLGHNHPYSTLELIGCIEEYFGQKAVIAFEQGPKGDVERTFASITKSQKALKFNPKVSLKEGMNKFLDWYVHQNPIY